MDNAISDLVRDWRLDIKTRDGCTIQTQYVSNASTGQWRTYVEEKWDRAEKLGCGTFGDVWVERCISGPGAGKARAVKEIKTSFAPSLAAPVMLSQGLLAIIKFSHKRYQDCFVQAFGWYGTKASVFIVMEYHPLGNLMSHLNNPLPETQAKRITSQILQGLVFMHQGGFTHRNLKPENVLVQQKGPNWWVKISDFGTSQQIEAETMRTRMGMQTYLAPEVQGYHAPSSRESGAMSIFAFAVDIWALGAITFRVATGQVPFSSGRDLYRYVVAGGAFPVVDSLSTQCSGFIARTMSASPSQRPTAEAALASRWIRTPSLITESSNLNNQLIPRVPRSATWPNVIARKPVASSSHYNAGTESLEEHPRSHRIQTQSSTGFSSGRFKKVQMFDGYRSYVSAMAFSPDGKWLATSSNEKIHMWIADRRGDFQWSHSLSGHTSTWIHQLAFTSHSRRLVSFGYEPVMIVWEASDRGQFREIERLNFGANAVVDDASLSQNAERLIVAWHRKHKPINQTNLWKISPRDPIQEIQNIKGLPRVRGQLLSADGMLYARYVHNLTNIWRLNNDGVFEVVQELAAAFDLAPIAFSPDCQWLVLHHPDKQFLWNYDTQVRFHDKQELDVRLNWRNAAVFSPDSRMLAMCLVDNTIGIWEIDNDRRFILTEKLGADTETPGATICSIAFSPDGRRLASVWMDSTVIIWEIRY